ncbi:hypothetical protein EYF80_033645 [Liparis tanakae]|uniref:Uncharacterized protein n=1 Tax=Liparis tanakae TaxID=230148 RepID=A0A4Z2GSF6_9TELE|nr:hypothetical protein EYF80_033645 [Liparis tanakae]
MSIQLLLSYMYVSICMVDLSNGLAFFLCAEQTAVIRSVTLAHDEHLCNVVRHVAEELPSRPLTAVAVALCHASLKDVGECLLNATTRGTGLRYILNKQVAFTSNPMKKYQHGQVPKTLQENEPELLLISYQSQSSSSSSTTGRGCNSELLATCAEDKQSSQSKLPVTADILRAVSVSCASPPADRWMQTAGEDARRCGAALTTRSTELVIVTPTSPLVSCAATGSRSITADREPGDALLGPSPPQRKLHPAVKARASVAAMGEEEEEEEEEEDKDMDQ